MRRVLRRVRGRRTFIVPVPKSGNTRVRFLIASMQSPEEEISLRNIERSVPDIRVIILSVGGIGRIER
jgi:hypothetical protein